MQRRALLKRAGIGAAVLAGLPLGATGALAAENGRVGFRFAAATTANAADGSLVVLGDHGIADGCGAFDPHSLRARGGGRLTHTDASFGTVRGTASWRARRLISFTQQGTNLGSHAAGIAKLEVEIRPDSAPGKVNATLTINCNLPGRDTGSVEGITLQFGPNRFDPLAETGASLFIVGAARHENDRHGDHDDDHDGDD